MSVSGEVSWKQAWPSAGLPPCLHSVRVYGGTYCQGLDTRLASLAGVVVALSSIRLLGGLNTQGLSLHPSWPEVAYPKVTDHGHGGTEGGSSL